MGRIEPPAQADLHQRQVGPGLGEPREDDRGQQLELGRLAVPPRDPVGDVEDDPDQPGEVVGGDRPAVDADPLAIGDQVRLGRGAGPIAGGSKRGVGQGQHAALAVGAADERAAHGPFRIAQFVQQRPRSPEPKPDAEPAAIGQRLERLSVGQAHRAAGHSRVSSSS